jgi:hypothetical protein
MRVHLHVEAAAALKADAAAAPFEPQRKRHAGLARPQDLLEEPVEETLAPARDDEREPFERRAERDAGLAVHDARVEIERRALPFQARPTR